MSKLKTLNWNILMYPVLRKLNENLRMYCLAGTKKKFYSPSLISRYLKFVLQWTPLIVIALAILISMLPTPLHYCYMNNYEISKNSYFRSVHYSKPFFTDSNWGYHRQNLLDHFKFEYVILIYVWCIIITIRYVKEI